MLRVLFSFLIACGALAQPLDHLRNLVVEVKGGSGIVVARTKSTVLIVTAAHVVEGLMPGDDAGGDMVLVATACERSGACPDVTPRGEPCSGSKNRICGPMDLALLVSRKSRKDRDFALSGRGSLKVRDKVGMAGFLNVGSRYYFASEAIGDVVEFQTDSPIFRYTARFGILPTGISGGAVFDARGRLRGIQSDAADPQIGVQLATRWDVAAQWIEAVLSTDHGSFLNRDEANRLLKHRIHPRSDSVTAIDRGETEIAGSLQTILIPGSAPDRDPGVSKLSPGVRIARPVPLYHGILITGDLAFSGPSQPLGNQEFINREILMAGIGAQLQAGEHVAVLRKSRAFGGIYLGGGLGWLSVTTRRVEKGPNPMSTQSWAPFVESGWRLRMPRRAWGFQASYREVLSGTRSDLPGRVHMISAGAFIVLK